MQLEFSPISSKINVLENENTLEYDIMLDIQKKSYEKQNKMLEPENETKKRVKKRRKKITMPRVKTKSQNIRKNIMNKKNLVTGKQLVLPDSKPSRNLDVTIKNGSLCFRLIHYNLRSTVTTDTSDLKKVDQVAICSKPISPKVR